MGAFVITRNSAYTYKGKGIDVKRIGEELGVRYVLEGSVRRLGELLRVNVQLISTESGAHLWADRSDERMPELSLGQEDIVKRIGNALGWEMVPGSRPCAVQEKERPTNPDAFDLYLRAQSLDNLPYNLERSAEASALLERAVQLDPSFARAKAFLARTLIDQFADAPEGRTEDKLTRAATLLSDAEAIIPSSKRVLIGRASLLWWQERYPEALAAAQRLMEVYPNDADASTMLAILTLATGGANGQFRCSRRQSGSIREAVSWPGATAALVMLYWCSVASRNPFPGSSVHWPPIHTPLLNKSRKSIACSLRRTR